MLTYAQAAEKLTCSIKTVRRIVSDGQLHPIKIRGLHRFNESDINNLIRKCEITAYTPNKKRL